jgi:quinol monooxygenase YgiN
MFLRVVHSSIDPAKIDDVLALKDDVIAATKKQAGFVSFQGGVSRATGAFITISTWQTEAAGKLRPGRDPRQAHRAWTSGEVGRHLRAHLVGLSTDGPIAGRR